MSEENVELIRYVQELEGRINQLQTTTENISKKMFSNVKDEVSHADLKDVKNGGNNGHVKDGDGHDHTEGKGATIKHSNLEGAGKKSHADLDTHLENKENPHGVTADQVKAVSVSGGKISSKKKAALALNREDIGLILSILSQNKAVLDVTDNEVTLSVRLKAEDAEFKSIKLAKLNGIEFDKLFDKNGKLSDEIIPNGLKSAVKALEEHKKGKNPHGLSASDLGALSTDGGEVTGSLSVLLQNDDDRLVVLNQNNEPLFSIDAKGVTILGRLSSESLKVKELDADKIGNMDLREGKLSHQDLHGAGKKSHDEIDKHLEAKGNPHGLKISDIVGKGDIKGDMLSKDSVGSENLSKQSVKPLHMSTELGDHIKSKMGLVSQESFDSFKNEVDSNNGQLNGSISKLFEKIGKLEKIKFEDPAPVKTLAIESVDQIDPSKLEGGLDLYGGRVKFTVDKYLLNISGIRGLVFKSGDDTVALTTDGVLINGHKIASDAPQVVQQAPQIDEDALMKKFFDKANKNLQSGLDDNTKAILDAVKEMLNSVTEEFNKRLHEADRSYAEKLAKISDTISIPGVNFENGTLTFQAELVKFESEKIEFNETASMLKNGDFVTKGNVCGINLKELATKDGSIDHTKLKNAGKVAHSDLDRHVNMKNNPHNVRTIQTEDGEAALQKLARLEQEVNELKGKM